MRRWRMFSCLKSVGKALHLFHFQFKLQFGGGHLNENMMHRITFKDYSIDLKRSFVNLLAHLCNFGPLSQLHGICVLIKCQLIKHKIPLSDLSYCKSEFELHRW